ncbi:MAG: 2Fe-2S iron-sulfur cluster binding domain-containing protein [Alphaproteobacteria bacterium]|nr:2Fe-2S iron-sulfur cluster binding domain-containing protein [Alphaproteobacteria bacterium]MBV8549476.1 2Fe-2S iron-sulfur cluster binding domain-containing protein [Alphaproteobacteria bacterium]
MTTIRLHVTDREGRESVLDVETGQSLMLAARNAGVEIEGACDGAMACSTCHVIIDSLWSAQLPPIRVEESDTLALASHPTRLSRLACQIMLTPQMDGLRFKLPKNP